ncbi:MAG: UDP-N-acetylmuramoyl-tripeptide--D-alanyl-D-alanine ligase [Bacteroidota bacterium]
MKLSLKDFQKLGQAEIINKETLKNKTITGVSTDSRTIEPGNIFFALRGENFDGHKFIEDVVKRNAAVVIVDAAWEKKNHELSKRLESAVVVVPDTIKALGGLANIYRKKFSIPVIAIGGSNGKTTTKEMISAVLRSAYSVLSTEGNLNNHIGVPQMLFRLTSKHDIAVLELGTNHFGEMKYLSKIVEPTHALVTNIGKEHLEFFGDERGVAKEETELFAKISAKGFAFINADDGYLVRAGKKVRHSLSYGLARTSDVQGRHVRTNEKGQPLFELAVKKKTSDVCLSVTGLHNVSNALAATAVGVEFKVPEKKIISAIQQYVGASKRMEVIRRSGITIINDTYNANPDSVLAALRSLQSMKVDGKKIVVLADMLELGEKAENEHAKIGLAVSDLEFEFLLTFGPLSRFTHEASKLAFAEHFESKEALIASLKSQVAPGDAVLIKGSRGMKMEEVTAQI